MSSANPRRTRSERVASLTLRPGRLERAVERLWERETWQRIGLCCLCLAAVAAATTAWLPPFSAYTGFIPGRDVVARVAFTFPSERHGDQPYEAGAVLARRNVPLTPEDIAVLYAEYLALYENWGPVEKSLHAAARLGVYAALFLLCGFYVRMHHPRVLRDYRSFVRVVVAITLTIVLAILTARDAWRAQIVPVVLFGMTMAIAHERELAMLLGIAVTLVITMALGQALPEFVILLTALTAPVLMLDRIRTRTKLIHVGVAGAAIVLVTAACVSLVSGQAFGASQTTMWAPMEGIEVLSQPAYYTRVLWGAGWFALCVVLGGFVMTGLLPFIERLFEAPTDISLLELGDAANPLLQELARRAPGTYNHSINVASLAEAAAEAIGANGLLTRVGAYFHDIGKLLKPTYFVENQSDRRSQHDALLPAMSTLVIVAHIKDGANLARRHHLPQAIIDFIEQHHGTTLIEYFYRQAEKLYEADPDGGALDETTYRYPGPKPQTKETAVLMLADMVEGASRTLVEPTPSRIKDLTHELTMKRLLDGQFDDCGLTLRELHAIEERLVKSLTAVYHGRVKYPTQQTA